MSYEDVFILIVAVASISFKPGPGMVAIVSRAIEFGFVSAFMVSMGAIIVELFYFMLAYFGFAFIEGHIGSLSIILKIFGSAYLLFLAYQTFNKSKQLNVATALDSNSTNMQTGSYFKDFILGVVVTLSNPLVILFYTALIPTVLNLSKIDISGLLTALSIIFGVHFIILTSQCVLATQVRVFLKDKMTVQKFNIISALLLTGVALFILSGLVKTLIGLG